jgi:hypothetical protein
VGFAHDDQVAFSISGDEYGLVLFVAETGYFMGSIPQIRNGPDMGHRILLS